jgi:hypothetical protein
MSNVKNLKEHAHKVLKENIDTAERVVQEIQSQWNIELGDVQQNELNERIQRSKDKIEGLKTKEHNEENMIKLLQEMNKLKALEETLSQPLSQRFNTDPVNESDPNLIIEDLDEETFSNMDEVLTELEKKRYDV